MGGHANGIDPQFIGHLQVIDGADTRQQQGRDLGVFHHRDYGRQVLLIGVRRKPVID